jgi:hypothetical protein
MRIFNFVDAAVRGYSFATSRAIVDACSASDTVGLEKPTNGIGLGCAN